MQTNNTIAHDDVQVIADAIRAAAVSSSTDAMLPILRGVHLRMRGDVLTVTGTDRFRLTRVTVEGVTSGRGDFDVTLEDVSALLKTMPRRTATGKPGKGGAGPVLLEVDDDAATITFTFDFGRQVARANVATGDYPNTDKLGRDDAAPVTRVKINPRHLADLAKHPLERNQAPVWTFRGQGSTPPARADWEAFGVRYAYLVMPHRITDNDVTD